MKPRPRVWHVGRAGDIPGGMTQVINAYLEWPFPSVTVDVLTSRANPGDHVTALRLFVAALFSLRSIRRRSEPAVIVVHLSERGSFVREGTLARYAARLGLPVIAHLHGSEYAAFERAHPALVGKVLRACSHVITLSDEASAISARHVGTERVSLVPNAIPDGVPGVKTRSVVFGGVVSERKGIDILQTAWRTIAAEYPDWELIIAGPTRDEHLADRALPSARFLGSIPHERLLTLLDDAAVAVLPSRDEAMPMFLLEAMARRACVVSTTVGGIPALVDGDGGVLVPPADADALTVALRGVLGDERRRLAVAERGHERFAREYSAEAIYPRVERVWLDALVKADVAPANAASLVTDPV